MAQSKLDAAKAEAYIETIEEFLRQGYPPPGENFENRKGAVRLAAEQAGLSPNSSYSRLAAATRAAGRDPDWSLWCDYEGGPEAAGAARAPQSGDPGTLADAIRAALKDPLTLDQLARRVDATKGQTLDEIERLQAEGVNIHQIGERYSLERTPAPRAAGDEPGFEMMSDDDNRFVFGVVTDNHIGSKYARLDVLNNLYDRFAARGITHVYNAGNWIDGEARFNRFDLVAHGMHEQIQHLVRDYPQRPGITTHAVAGDDHEGWYSAREGVDIGRYAENQMRAAGRNDWIYMGYMEADVRLMNARSGEGAVMRVVHPGGGSAYAISYSVQKLVECVPLDSEALTRDGWMHADDIQPGDEVLGYNIETDRCEWTEVKGINRGRSPVVRFHNDQFDVRCTPNHRWAIEWESRGGPNQNSVEPAPYRRRERVLWTLDESKARSRIIQAAPAPDGPGMPDLDHQEWLRREIAVETVLQMSSGERRAFIEGLMLGEGTVGLTRGYRTLVFSQRPGPVNDAFRLACFLEGIATTDRASFPGNFKPDGEPTRRVTMLKKRMRNVGSLRREDVGEREVWCPTTGLGTWVMRQGDLITITGNSYEGGDKPAVVVVGHYHKQDIFNYRNVWCIQGGTTQDQTPFMRKKKLEAHVGGLIVTLEQDPKTGAIISCNDMFRYFNKDYYEGDRWSHHGEVMQPKRTLGGV